MRNFITVPVTQSNLNDQVKEDEMGRACNIMGEMRNAYRILVGKREGRDH
jgi:hypothetical protein